MGMLRLTPERVDLACAGMSSSPSSVWVGVLIDGESAAGVLHEEVEQSFARQGRKLTYYFIGYEVEATAARLQCYFNLFYHFLVDELTRDERQVDKRQVDKRQVDKGRADEEQGMSEILSLF